MALHAELFGVRLFLEPDAGNPPVRFDERVVSRRREIVVLYER